MSLALAMSYLPSYAALPAYLRRSAIAISPRFPRPGGSNGSQAIGTDGSSSTVLPQRSAIEAQAWGANVALWSYTNLAAQLGYASTAQFVGEFNAAGIPIQGTINTSSVNDGAGPFAIDAGGSTWNPGSSGTRPALSSGSHNPVNSRITISVSLMPAADSAGTVAPKVANCAAQMVGGVFGLHMDDPRAHAGYSGWRGIVGSYDITSQGVDFSATARAGFTAWLTANTTADQRTVLNLPASLAGFDIVAWLRANHPGALHGANQVDATAIDNYLYRTALTANSNLRDVMLGLYNRYLRDEQASFTQQVRSTLGGAPLSSNFWQASPSEFISGYTRRPGLFDFAIAETAPDYWQDLSSHATGSAEWLLRRDVQCARRHMNAVSYDLCGQRAFVEHKPTALNTAPPRVVVQMLRQSILQSVAEGMTPVVPIDVFMTVNDTKSQGVTVDGYRYWGSRADYKTCFDFIRDNAAAIDGYEKLATVFLAAHNGSFPFQDGAGAARYNAILERLAELWRADVDYHWLTVGEADGMLPQDPVRGVETSAPIILRVQDDGDYYSHLGRLTAPRCRAWNSHSVREAMLQSPVRSLSPTVRALARYNPTAQRVSVHLVNLAINADGTPKPQTTVIRWNRAFGQPLGLAAVSRLGEAGGSVDLVAGHAQVTLREYAIVNFAVAP